MGKGFARMDRANLVSSVSPRAISRSSQRHQRFFTSTAKDQLTSLGVFNWSGVQEK